MQKKAFVFLIAFLFNFPPLCAVSYGQTNYSETIKVLTESYNSKLQAKRNYLAFPKMAVSDNYVNIAYLFNALSVSEDIHAENFKKILYSKENYSDAIKNITFARESEKQHRDLIEKISSNIGMFFGVIAKKIESEPTVYFVCTICGSTLTELPQYYCPICKGPVSAYKEVKKQIADFSGDFF